MSEYEKIAKTTDIPPGEIRGFPLGSLMVAIANVDGEYYAFRDECTHEALPLSDGTLNGKVITCAYHSAEFEVDTGTVLCLPAIDDLETFSLRIDGDEIYVLIED